MKFEHFIITRFNLKKKGWDTTKSGSKVLTEAWLCNRLELFSRYCLPSVQGQSSKNFRWLVYFDVDTPEKFKPQIAEWAEKIPQFEPLYVKDMEVFLPSIRQTLQASPAEYVITSRVDNDDAIAKDFVERLQAQFASQEFEAIDFVEGYSLFIAENGVYFGKKKHLNNHFISLIERKTTTLKSVWHHSHAGWKKEKAVKRLYDAPMWMALIHGENKVNTFDATGFADLEKALERFSLNESVKQELIQTQIPGSRWWSILLKNRLKDLDKYYFTLLKMKLRRKG